MIAKGPSNIPKDMGILTGQSQYDTTTSGKGKKFKLWELGVQSFALGEEPLPMAPSC